MNVIEKMKMFEGHTMPGSKTFPAIAWFLVLFALAIVYGIRGEVEFCFIWAFLSLQQLAGMGRIYWRHIMMKAVICNDKRLDLLEGKK